MTRTNSLHSLFCAFVLLVGCSTQTSTPTGNNTPSSNPVASATPSPSPSPAASPGGSIAVSGKVTLEQMKAYSVCFKAAGSSGAAIASGIDPRIAIAESFIKNGTPAEFAQGQLDLAYNAAKELQVKYNINCIK